MAKEGIHAMLFVLSARNRITKEEESTLFTLQRIFDSKIFEYFIVVFTGGDELEANNQTLDDYLHERCPEFLTRILKLCGGRKILFDNRTTDKDKKAKQLKQVLAHVADVGRQTGGKPYTDQMHHRIKEEGNRLREQQRMLETKNLAAEVELMKKNLELEYDEKLRRMAQILERRLKQSSEAHERAMRDLREAQPVRRPQNFPVYHPLPQPRAPPPECNIM